MNPIQTRNITRREAMVRVGKLGLLAGALGPVALRGWAADSKPEFKFLVVNDTHYATKECAIYFAGLVRQMNGEKPAFVLHAGDVTDKGEAAHLQAARKAFGELDCPFHPVIGNHDWITSTNRKPYLDTFPLKLNYSFWHRGWQFIGLDSSEGQKADQTNIQPATFGMLDDILGRLERKKPTVVFTHFPLCPEVKMRPLNADKLLAKFDGWNTRAFFNSHFHGFTECQRGDAAITTNRCCALIRNNHDGTKEKGYFVCTAKGGQITRAFVEYKPA